MEARVVYKQQKHCKRSGMIGNVGDVPLQCERDINNNFKGQIFKFKQIKKIYSN